MRGLESFRRWRRLGNGCASRFDRRWRLALSWMRATHRGRSDRKGAVEFSFGQITAAAVRWRAVRAGPPNVAAVAVLLLVLSSLAALADRIPGTAASGRHVYFTEDMSSVSIELTAVNERYHQHISLPRAFLYFVPGYRDPPHRELPDEVSSDSAFLVMTFDGDPLSIAVRALQIAYYQREDKERHRLGSATAVKQLRPETAWVRMSASLFTEERACIL